MIELLISVPAMAASRLAFLTHAMMLTASAIGGVTRIVSPPRAVMGEPHPGCSNIISAIVTGATRDKPRPIRPVLVCGPPGSGGI